MGTYFNTSNVTIQQDRKLTNGQVDVDFNTSNVTIQPFLRKLSGYIQDYFNTSNVTIQHSNSHFLHLTILISIHLMLLFNFIEHKLWWTDIEFQYI